jgi:hypothetical protein
MKKCVVYFHPHAMLSMPQMTYSSMSGQVADLQADNLRKYWTLDEIEQIAV